MIRYCSVISRSTLRPFDCFPTCSMRVTSDIYIGAGQHLVNSKGNTVQGRLYVRYPVTEKNATPCDLAPDRTAKREVKFSGVPDPLACFQTRIHTIPGISTDYEKHTTLRNRGAQVGGHPHQSMVSINFLKTSHKAANKVRDEKDKHTRARRTRGTERPFGYLVPMVAVS